MSADISGFTVFDSAGNIKVKSAQGGSLPDPVTVAHGGTGDTTLAAHGVLIGAGTSPVNVTGAGTTGQVLTSNGPTSDPTFQAAAGATRSAFSSRPAAGNTGALFLSSDAYQLEHDNGSTWDANGPLFPFIPPSDSGYAWVNQGSSSLDTRKDALVLTGAATGSGANLVCRVKSAPATPWMQTAFMIGMCLNKPFQSFGLLFRNSGTGAIAAYDVLHFNSTEPPLLRSTKFTNATTFSADYTTVAISTIPNWFRIADDGTNRICSFSPDGQHWIQFHSVARTDFMTADQVGYFVSTENSATQNYAPILTVLSLSV